VRPPRAFGPFRIARELGRGGTGVVFLARDARRGPRPLALKLPRPEVLLDGRRLARFLAEGRVAARLDHPGLVPPREAGMVEGIPYLAGPPVLGPSLAARLATGRAFPAPVAARLVAELAGAIAHLHRRGFLHLDLAPANVLLGRAGPSRRLAPRVIDLGLARPLVLGVAWFDDPLPPAASARFVAPELLGPAPARVDARADVYALGAILDALARGAGEPRLLRLAAWCLADDPERRCPDPATLADALRPLAPPAPDRRSGGHPEGPGEFLPDPPESDLS
jgi:serine/threonine-protein kinase